MCPSPLKNPWLGMGQELRGIQKGTSEAKAQVETLLRILRR